MQETAEWQDERSNMARKGDWRVTQKRHVNGNRWQVQHLSLSPDGWTEIDWKKNFTVPMAKEFGSTFAAAKVEADKIIAQREG